MRTLSTIAVVAVAATTALPCQAETLAACDQSLEYKIQPPVGGTGAGFSGVWVGKWDTGLCGALVVESIEPNGSARLLYVNGSMGGQYSMKAGNRRFPGKIDGNKLTAAGQSITIEYILRSPTELAGTYTSQYGSFKGSFRKQP